MHGFPSQEELVAHPAVDGRAMSMSAQDKAAMVLDYAYDLRKDFEERDRIFEKVDNVIYLREKVKIPDNFKNTAIEVRSPMPTHTANSIAAALSLNTPKVTYKPTEFGDAGEDQAAYRAAFFENSWNKQQQEKDRAIQRLFMYSLTTKGVGILKTVDRRNRAWAKYAEYAKDLLKDLDAQYDRGEIDEHARRSIFDGYTERHKRGCTYPIETTDIPPETFYYQRGEDGFVRCIEIKDVPYYETLCRYGAGLNRNGKVVPHTMDSVTSLALPDSQWYRVFGNNSRRCIQMVEYWDCYTRKIILRGPGDIPAKGAGFVGSGLLVKEDKHNYGNHVLGTLEGPYFFSSGITTSSRKPEHENLSVLFAYLHLYPLLNALLTMQSQAAFTYAFPAYKRTTPPTYGMAETPFGRDAREIHENRRQIIPGGIFPHDIAAMDQPRTSVDLERAISFVVDLLSRALPDTVQGVITGETAGYAINQASHLATIAWSPITDNAQRALSKRVGFESWLIENHIGEPVYVPGNLPRPRVGRRYSGNIIYRDGWIGMGPKQLHGSHLYNVELKPVSLNNDTLILRNLKEELDMRTISYEEAVRIRGRNPVDVERSWMLRDLKNDPAIQEQLKQRIFRQLATIDQQALLGIPEGGAATQQPSIPLAAPQGGVSTGIAQGLPTTGFVPPQAAVPPPPPAGTEPQLPSPSGTPAGAPAGVRGTPTQYSPLPGE